MKHLTVSSLMKQKHTAEDNNDDDVSYSSIDETMFRLLSFKDLVTGRYQKIGKQLDIISTNDSSSSDDKKGHG